MTKSDLLTVRLTPELTQKLKTLAVKNGTTMSLLIRDLIENAELVYPTVVRDKKEKAEGQEQIINLMVKAIMESVINNLSPELLDNLGEAAHRAAKILSDAGKKEVKSID